MSERVSIGSLRQGASRTIEIEVEELGGTVMLRSITRGELNQIRTDCGFETDDGLDTELMDILILLAAWVEPAELHDEKDPAALLRLQPAGLINDLTRAAMKVSGLTTDERFLS